MLNLVWSLYTSCEGDRSVQRNTLCCCTQSLWQTVTLYSSTRDGAATRRGWYGEWRSASALLTRAPPASHAAMYQQLWQRCDGFACCTLWIIPSVITSWANVEENFLLFSCLEYFLCSYFPLLPPALFLFSLFFYLILISNYFSLSHCPKLTFWLMSWELVS